MEPSTIPVGKVDKVKCARSYSERHLNIMFQQIIHAKATIATLHSKALDLNYSRAISPPYRPQSFHLCTQSANPANFNLINLSNTGHFDTQPYYLIGRRTRAARI